MPLGPPIESLHFSPCPSVDNPPGPESQQLRERQQGLESGAVQYPLDLPIGIDAARGATIRDSDDNVYLDFFSGIGVTNVGHANPYVAEAVADQSRRLVHTLDFPTDTRLRLIEALADIVPVDLGEDMRVLFGGPTGSDAIEASIKLAKAATGGTGLIAFRGAYHGGTAGALSLTADREERAAGEPLLSNVQHLPYPAADDADPESSARVALDSLEETLGSRYSGITDPAGIWIEPIQGESGIIVPPAGFLRQVRELADIYEVPLIVDEVQTGFGRTGRWFGADHDDVSPDIMPIAKGFANGHPLAATIYRNSIDEAVDPALHAGTFRGYLPAMRAALRTIEYIQGRNLIDHADQLGDRIATRLEDEIAPSSLVRSVRGRGLYHAIEFRSTGDRSATVIRDAVRRRCLEAGLLVWGGGRAADAIRLMPPLVVTSAHVMDALDSIAAAVAAETDE